MTYVDCGSLLPLFLERGVRFGERELIPLSESVTRIVGHKRYIDDLWYTPKCVYISFREMSKGYASYGSTVT